MAALADVGIMAQELLAHQVEVAAMAILTEVADQLIQDKEPPVKAFRAVRENDLIPVEITVTGAVVVVALAELE